MLRFNELPLRVTLTAWIVTTSLITLVCTLILSYSHALQHTVAEQVDYRDDLYQALANMDTAKQSSLTAYLSQQKDLKAAALLYPDGTENSILTDAVPPTLSMSTTTEPPSATQHRLTASRLELLQPIYQEHNNKPILFLYTAADISDSIQRLQYQYLILASLFVTVGLIAVLAVTSSLRKRVTRPLEILAQNAGLISRGEYGVLSSYDGQNEIGRLAHSLNLIGRASALYVANIESRNQQLTTFLNSGLVAMAVVSVEGHFVEANTHWLSITELDLDELEGTSVADLIHPESAEEFLQAYQRLQASWDEVEMNVKIHSAAREGYRWVHLLAKRLQLLDTDKPVILYFMRDIQAKIKYESELKLSAVAFETQEAIVIFDAEKNVIKVNSAFCKVTGYSSDEVIGRSPAMLRSDRYDQEFFSRIWAQVDEVGHWEGEIWDKRSDGSVSPDWHTISVVVDEFGNTTHYVGFFRDISEQKQAEKEIKKLAFYDDLTGLPNRRFFYKRLHQTVASCCRRDSRAALLFVDLDHFKDVNDSLGHLIGDQLLKEVAVRLNQTVRAEDTIARLGGDEFVILLENISGDYAAATVSAEMLAERIMVLLSQPVTINEHTLKITTSIGISMISSDINNVNDVLRQADMAMYQSKEAGRSTVRFFSEEMQQYASARMQLRSDLEVAISQNQFCLALQPQVDVIDGSLHGVEALIRWQHPQKGLLNPGDFLSIAEESDLIIDIGNWALIEACRIQRELLELGVGYGRLAINIDPKHFHRPRFVEETIAIIQSHKGIPENLCIEITEGVAIDNLQEAADKIKCLQQAGVWVAIDDFGVGYSSLSYLVNLQAKELKLDRSFILQLAEKHEARVMVKSVLSLAEKLGFHVVAEGVETDNQRTLLASLGCSTFQGYFESKPLLEADFFSYAKAKEHRPRSNYSYRAY